MDYIQTATCFFFKCIFHAQRQPSAQWKDIPSELRKSFQELQNPKPLRGRGNPVGCHAGAVSGLGAWAQQGEVPLQRRLPCPSSKRMRRLRLALSILIHRKFVALSDLVNEKQGSTLETKCAASTNTSCGLSWMVLSAAPVAVQVTSTYIHLSVSVSYSWLMVSNIFFENLSIMIYHDLS